LTLEDPLLVRLKMLYVKSRMEDGLGDVWALKDDDALGSVVKAMAAGSASE